MGKTVSTPMTKNLLMNYTFYALFVIAFLSFLAFGLQSLVLSIVCVGVALLCEILVSKFMGKKNLMSAAVFGLIVAMSYSLGETNGMGMFTEKVPTLSGELETYIIAALISAVGLIVFKKLQGLAGRKYVNPAAISKLLILALLFMPIMSIFNYSALMPESHSGDANAIDLQNPWTPDAFGGPDFQPISTEKFVFTLLGCYAQANYTFPSLDNYFSTGVMEDYLPDVLNVMVVAKYHGWVGGFSSILVIAMGIVLFVLARGYMKWRITIAYLVSTAVLAVVMNFMFGGDLILRLLFHLFMGSSIFMAFFMATDPATTPLTRLGQIIFGVGLGVLTVVIQTFTGFLGGSILALVIMNLTTPLLDKVGVPKPSETRLKIKLPKAKKFTDVETSDCIRCGMCLTACCRNLPPILIKEAVDKGDWEKAEKLGAGYCDNCGHCSFVCPARIDLRTIVVSAKDKIKNQ
jgi:electron transport complex protein RnfD